MEGGAEKAKGKGKAVGVEGASRKKGKRRATGKEIGGRKGSNRKGRGGKGTKWSCDRAFMYMFCLLPEGRGPSKNRG